MNIIQMDLGTNFPLVHSIRSLPSPTKVVWPQLLFDITYSGGMELTIETNLELREAAKWDGLTRSMTNSLHQNDIVNTTIDNDNVIII